MSTRPASFDEANHHQQLDTELRRRLDFMASDSYVDPARRDLARLDFAILVAVNLVVVALMFWMAWG